EMPYVPIFGLLVNHGARRVDRERGELGQPAVVGARRKGPAVRGPCWRRGRAGGALIRRTPIPLDPERDPTITTTSVVDFEEADGQVWFQVQDGAYPAVLSRLVGGFDPTR